jgi:hypothetical protein
VIETSNWIIEPVLLHFASGSAAKNMTVQRMVAFLFWDLEKKIVGFRVVP